MGNENTTPHGSLVPPHSFRSSPRPGSESARRPTESLPVDPFSVESDEGEATAEDEDSRKNTIGNASHSSRSNTAPKMPPNPFQKTLANHTSGASAVDVGERSGNATPNAVAGVRPHYDVDDFKRLLLTGEKSVAEASAASTPSTHSQGTQNVGDNSSNTDASSVSRHSIFEPLPGTSQETPRTSHEVSPSGDETQLPVQKSSPRTGRMRPPAPKPRYSNPTVGNIPQTVSFQDPILSFQPSSNSQTALQGWHTPSSPWSPTDLNKPLPLPPAVESLEYTPEEPALLIRRRPQSEYFEPPGLQSNSPSLKRDPPAPPLARRHSQLRPKSFMGPGRSTRISEESLVDAKPPQRHPIASAEPPPPPPPRRSGLTRSLSTASTSSSASALRAPSATSVADDDNSKSAKSPPPVPPTRTPSISVKRPPKPSPTANSSPTIAPPPPPRKRGSSHNSLTQSRPSGDYSAERSRVSSGASSTMAITPNTEEKDVLADLTALQREVDELRGKLK